MVFQVTHYEDGSRFNMSYIPDKSNVIYYSGNAYDHKIREGEGRYYDTDDYLVFFTEDQNYLRRTDVSQRHFFEIGVDI